VTEPTVPRITKTQYEAVRTAHILRPAYKDARLFGATHGEILAAHGAHIDVRSYGYARTAGATHAELLEAQSAGAEISTYVDARRASATHWEVLAVCREGVPLHDYMKVRRKHATHDEAIGAHRAMIPLRDYANARSASATHEEIMTAHAAGVPPRTYSLLRKREMTHREILAVHEIAISLRAKPDEIVDALNNATVAELVAAYRAGIDPAGYSRARARGENHKTAMGVAATIDRDGGADFDCYIAAREMGATHEEALLLSPHQEIRSLEWWQRDLILQAVRSLAPEQRSPAVVENICGLGTDWGSSPQDLADAACKTTSDRVTKDVGLMRRPTCALVWPKRERSK
jgi:hypothetical protein